MAIELPDIRQDARNVPNGVDVASMTLVGLAKDTWLQPNITYTLHKFKEAGQLIIPKVIRGVLTQLRACVIQFQNLLITLSILLN